MWATLSLRHNELIYVQPPSQDFCCHAATRLHSVIPRSIKRCGYPGRRESCLSFRSRLFFPPFFRLPTPRPRTRSASPVSYTTPSPPPSCPLSFQNSQQWWCRFSIWGKSLHCLTFPFSFIFLFRAFGFFMECRLISSIQGVTSLFAGQGVIVWCSCSCRLLPCNVCILSVILD